LFPPFYNLERGLRLDRIEIFFWNRFNSEGLEKHLKKNLARRSGNLSFCLVKVLQKEPSQSKGYRRGDGISGNHSQPNTGEAKTEKYRKQIRYGDLKNYRSQDSDQ